MYLVRFIVFFMALPLYFRFNWFSRIFLKRVNRNSSRLIKVETVLTLLNMFTLVPVSQIKSLQPTHAQSKIGKGF